MSVATLAIESLPSAAPRNASLAAYDSGLGGFRFHTRVSARTNDIEVVLTNLIAAVDVNHRTAALADTLRRGTRIVVDGSRFSPITVIGRAPFV